MSVPYERYAADEHDTIQVEDHERSGSESDPEEHEQRLHRAHVLFGNRWPKQNGILQLSTGFVLTILGLAEVLVLPVALDRTGISFSELIKLNKSNLYGLGIWTGIVLTLTGSLAIRASVYRNLCTVYTFFSMILFDMALFTLSVLFTLIGYSKHWTTRGAMPNDYLFGVHAALSVVQFFGMVIVVFSFTQYYEDVCCGEIQLAKRCIHCCCPCWCPPPVTQHELLQDPQGHERPPNLLV